MARQQLPLRAVVELNDDDPIVKMIEALANDSDDDDGGETLQ